MKFYFLFSVVFFLIASADKCDSKKEQSTLYKGKLEIKGICMNYTIRLLEGNIDTSKISTAWTDEVTGKSYTYVFALGSPCTFPASINEGDEFYFSIDVSTVQNCAVCLAYYPKPPQSLPVKVIEK